MTGDAEGTLFSVLDRTRTPMGGRLLKRWIHQPLNALDPIRPRLDAVEELTRLARRPQRSSPRPSRRSAISSA